MPEGLEPTTDMSGAEGGASVDQATSETLDLNAYGDYQVPVKVGGEERYVPLNEAVSGYMMQSDYTQKTQALAEEQAALEDARLLANALEADPNGAIEILMDVYGYSKAEATEAVAEASDEGDDSGSDPFDGRLDKIEQRFQEMEREQIEADVRGQLDQIQSETGIPGEELLRFALENSIPNLDIALSHFMRLKSDAVAEYEAQHKAAEDKRAEGKRDASFVSGGVNNQSGTVETPTEQPRSIAEAGRQAMAQLGFTG